MIRELSIIIPTLNEEKYLPLLLQSIVVQEALPERYEIIIVDGESEDRTREKLLDFIDKLPTLHLLKSKRGIGRQRNKGAEKAKYRYLLFLDADMILPRDFFTRLLPKINEKEQKFIATTMLWSSEKDFLDTLVLVFVLPFLLFFVLRHHYTPGAMTLTTKENHLSIGGFREDIVFGEELDYGERSLETGAGFHFFWSVVAYHSPRRFRMQGRFVMFFIWLQGYLKRRKYGHITSEKMIDYPYGKYE